MAFLWVVAIVLTLALRFWDVCNDVGLKETALFCQKEFIWETVSIVLMGPVVSKKGAHTQGMSLNIINT